MKSSAFIGLLVIVGCASGGANTGDQSSNIKHVLYGNTDFGEGAHMADATTWSEVAAPFSTTWQYLPIAYSRLGLAITKYDSVSHIIEGERLRSRADFGGKSLVQLLDCGEVAGVPNASRYDVTIQVRTGLRGTDKTSRIANVVYATAKASGVSVDPVPCAVNQGISDRITAAVTSAIAEGTK